MHQETEEYSLREEGTGDRAIGGGEDNEQLTCVRRSPWSPLLCMLKNNKKERREKEMREEGKEGREGVRGCRQKSPS